jgi:uncharacterized protein
MDPLLPYILPLKGMGEGKHQFDFDVDTDFFGAFEGTLVEEGQIDMQVTMDKSATLLVLNFSFSGHVQTTCDRCLTSIALPVAGENRLLVKYGDPEDAPIDEDVVFIPLETSKWSIAQFVYEYILLAMPLIKIYECEAEAELPCDQEMLDRLALAPDEAEEEQTNNPLWDALKDWDKDENN